MPLTNGFNHVATLTPDLDRFAAWYGEVFGATVVHEIPLSEGHPRMFIIDMGGDAAMNVFETDPAEIIGEQRRSGARGRIDHFGISVPDLDTLRAVKDRLVSVGADIGEIQRLGAEWSLFFRDVDGTELEVCCRA